jgi:hypothetical protein
VTNYQIYIKNRADFDEEAIEYQICRQNKVFLLRLSENTAKNAENRSRRRKMTITMLLLLLATVPKTTITMAPMMAENTCPDGPWGAGAMS